MKKTIKTIIEYLILIIIVILIRIFVITPVEVNGRSMESTLYNNDIMILNILGYKMNGLKRFDIIVIKYKDEHIIKRIIGLPGEKVVYKNNTLYINNHVVKDVSKMVTNNFSTEQFAKDGIIPKNKYFVLGDNRSNSADSRIIGLIDSNKIMGKTNLIIFPFNHFKIVK